MKTETITHQGRTFKRITKTTAKKLYDSGKEISLLGSNQNPNSYWTFPLILTSTHLSHDRSFDDTINAFLHYIPPELRSRVKFYAPTDES